MRHTDLNMNKHPCNNLHRHNAAKREQSLNRILNRIDDNAELEEKDKMLLYKYIGEYNDK